MRLGMIGLVRMGSADTIHLAEASHDCVVHREIKEVAVDVLIALPWSRRG